MHLFLLDTVVFLLRVSLLSTLGSRFLGTPTAYPSSLPPHYSTCFLPNRLREIPRMLGFDAARPQDGV